MNFNKTKRSKGAVRIPLPSIKYQTNELSRSVTIGQLAIMIWSLYRCVNDADIGYLDANLTLEDLFKSRLNQKVNIGKMDLQRLLWAVNMSSQHGFFWTPNNQSIEHFISAFLLPDEVFDRYLNLIINKDEAKKLNDKLRYIKKFRKRTKRKK